MSFTDRLSRSLRLALLACLGMLASACVLTADTELSESELGTISQPFETCGGSNGSCAADAVCVAPGRENPTVGFCAPSCPADGCGTGAACVLQLPGDTAPSACALTCTVTADCPEALLCQTFDGVGICIP